MADDLVRITPALLTVRQAAAYTGLGHNTVRSFIHSGKWQAIKVGVRDWRILTASINEWIAQEVAAQSQPPTLTARR